MLLKLLLFLFILSELNASKIEAEFEAGIYLPNLGGTITNSVAPSNFEDDFNHVKAEATYLSLDLTLDYDYIPNLFVSYYYMQNRENATLEKNVRVADGDFNSSVVSSLDYQVINFTLYQDFKVKGSRFSFFGGDFYSGDLEFDAGVNTKLLLWEFQVTDTSSSWIKVNTFIPLPYVGVKYYLYNLTLYGDTSILAFSKANSSSYRLGIDYKVVENLSFSAGYIYEQFEVLEEQDSVDFYTSGYKLSVKYAF